MMERLGGDKIIYKDMSIAIFSSPKTCAKFRRGIQYAVPFFTLDNSHS